MFIAFRLAPYTESKSFAHNVGSDFEMSNIN